MPVEDGFTTQKTIDVTPVKQKRKKIRIITILRWSVFVLWLIVIVSLGLKYHNNNDSFSGMFSNPQPVADAPPKPISIWAVLPQPVAQNNNAPKLPEPAPVVSEAPKAKEASPELASLSERVDKLEEQNKNLLDYFAAQDLKNSISDENNFKEQLAFLHDELSDDANVGGKIDLLVQSTADGIVTREKLLSELKTVEKNLKNSSDASFSGSISNAIGNLVKVSKIDGDVGGADYDSVIKRAEITLGKEKLSAAELQKTIDEVSKIGKPAENFIKDANNLERALEVTDFLVVYTKSKATGGND